MKKPTSGEKKFYYFAYGSCMCPVDLKRTLGENTHPYVIGPAKLKGYKIGFYRYSEVRKCGVLDVVKDESSTVEGVLYYLPLRLRDRLDEREDVRFDLVKQIHYGTYRPEKVDVFYQDQLFFDVNTYVVVDKLSHELAPNDWYFHVVLRGATTCGLSEEYCWKLFEHMHNLQHQKKQKKVLAIA
ncbi:gamma-glutamylcyclotransferase family protein [Okeania sp.]|uniref:gamma-glutamylcyclotransferase family protein n=1 Tax=Okeania sp. TaxID=3100323 RepID=UPI002B4B59C6|nr:gamma-glutamylcyclotransferase family protein [Okeania sp.]MEB3343215.1 gamma-glutamylcyclotransferase family protein [Okeania sp.]